MPKIQAKHGLALACGVLVAAVTAGAVMAPHGKAQARTTAATTTIACGDTVTHSITLGNDVVNCPSTGLTIAADHVTLNLNGHTIDGTGNGSGVQVNGAFAIVQNGSVEQFFNGVALAGANPRVQGVLVASDRFGINSSSANAVITGNSAAESIDVGIAVASGQHATVTNNTVRGSGTYGIHVTTPGSTVTGNKAISNDSTGIVAAGSGGIVVSGNIANGNGANGIATGGEAKTLSRNTTSFNTDLGVKATALDVDGGGNKATGNGDLHQCEDLVCS